jgi:hypothetical protein
VRLVTPERRCGVKCRFLKIARWKEAINDLAGWQTSFVRKYGGGDAGAEWAVATFGKFRRVGRRGTGQRAGGGGVKRWSTGSHECGFQRDEGDD